MSQENFFRRLNLELGSTQHTGEMASALESLRSDVMKLKFTDYFKAADYIETIGQKSKDVADEFQVTDAHVRRIRRELSNDAYAFYGVDIFLKVDEGDAATVQERVSAVSRDMSTVLLPKEILSQIPSGRGGSIPLSECQDEIRFLTYYRLSAMQYKLRRLDSDKLSRVVSILSEPPNETRDNLIKILSTEE